MKEYFTESTKINYFYLRKRDLISALNYDKISYFIKQYFDQKYAKLKLEILESIFKEINKSLLSSFGIQIRDFKEF